MGIENEVIWTDDGLIIAPIEDNGTIPLDSAVERRIIEAAKKAKEYSEFHPPIDYMDIGKRIGVSSTQGMELHAAMNKAYEEWKEKHRFGKENE
jgi:hypothetical protein